MLKKKVTVNFINAHCFNIAQIDNEYLDILNSSTYVLNDGVGIKLGGKILGVPVVENLNGTDLIPKILKMCEIEGYKVFLLGAKQKNLTDALRRAANLYPDLNIDGHDGFFINENKLICKINTFKPDIIITGLGVPKQEKFTNRNLTKFNTQVVLNGGAFIDFLSGNVPRAPRVLRSLNLEWLFRLYLEPRRLWKRYFIGNILFFINITRNK